MKLFVDLGTQLYLTDEPEDRKFSFFCTDINKFETFNGKQSWHDVQEFKEDYDGVDGIETYLQLIPHDWSVGWEDVSVTLFGKEVKGITSIRYIDTSTKSDLESALREAIDNEDYVEASRIRDKIKQLKL